MNTIRDRADILDRVLLVLATALVHLWLVVQNRLFEDVVSFGDISLYEYWAFQVQNGAGLYGLETEWVYPVLAFVPIWIASQIPFVSFEVGWLILVFVLNTAAVLLLQEPSDRRRRRSLASWVFLAALFLLGPVAIARIDAVSAALAIFALLAIARKSFATSSVLLTIAGWIKVWPVGIFLVMLGAWRRPTRALFFALAISVFISLLGLAVGSGQVFSFIFAQQDRGVQIESVLATPWLWLASFGQAEIFYDREILTNQIQGPLVSELASISNLFLFLALGLTVVLTIKAVRGGANRRYSFAVASLVAVLNLIVFNKVGSPQFMLWLAIGVVALVFFKVPKITFALVVSGLNLGLTQLIYPVLYLELLSLDLLPLILISARNLLLIVLMIWGYSRLTSKQFRD
jgi:hypothetical protein